MIYFEEQFLVRILYKSGNSQAFWATKFSIKTAAGGGFTYEWTTADPGYVRPVMMGVDEVEAVWQLRRRVRIRFGRRKK